MPSFFAKREGGRAVIVGGDARHLVRSLRAREGEEIEVVDPDGFAIANLPAPALELVLSRCTEAGAYAFHVVQADRSVARGAKMQRWSTICREAAMLAGRLKLPSVAGPSTLQEVLSAVEHPVLLARGAATHLADLHEPRDITLLVGPEGGWSAREEALVATKAGLGPRNLRADTAALVGLAVALVGRRQL